MLRNPQQIPEEQEEGVGWQDVMREAVQQAAQIEAEKQKMCTCDDSHHLPARGVQKHEERQRELSTVDKMLKKTPEKRRCGWPGMRFTPLQTKKKKGQGRKKSGGSI